MRNIILVWAWWTGMSGVAGMLHDLWYTNIVCIDANQSELTDKLKAKWMKVIIGHGKYKVQLGDVVIYSEATTECEEVLDARKIMKTNKKVMVILNYFQFLGEVSKYFTTIGFAGTNGKSSSTALAIHTAKKLVPNFWLGILWALVPSFDTKSYVINKKAEKDIRNIFDYIFTGKKLDYAKVKKRSFFVEACEYKRHFLHLDLDYTIITSLELDHTDYYKDIKDYLSAFDLLITKTKKTIFIPKWLKWVKSKKIKEVAIHNISFTHLLGNHNNINGSLVLALIKEIVSLSHIPCPISQILSQIKSFSGIWRRLEKVGKTKNGISIYSDYGHMASSIEFGYQALKKKFPKKKLFVIFQPHQINRIVLWRKDFQKTLKNYDQVMIYDIYAARENIKDFIDHHTFIKKENIKTLNDLGNHFAKECWGTYTTNFSVITKEIQKAQKDTVIVIYSAWDIDYKIRCRKSR